MFVPGNELFLKTSGAVAPGYPLDDDGTLAAMFGQGWLPTDAPQYYNADYTFLSPASPSTRIAAPSVARFLGSARIPFPAGNDRFGVELEINPPIGVPLDDVWLYVAFFNGMSIVTTANIGIKDVDGLTPIYNSTTEQKVRTDTSNIRIAIVVDPLNNCVYYTDGEGQIWGDFSGFTGATDMVLFMTLNDNGDTPAAEQMNMLFRPDAADMSALFPPDCYDYAGNPCPVNPSWVDPTPPMYPTITSAYTDIAGDTITVTFDMNVTGSVSAGWTFYKGLITASPYGFSQPSGNTFQYQFNTGTFTGDDVITLDYNSLVGSVVSDPAGDPLQSVTGYAVTNNIPPPLSPCGHPFSDADPAITLSNNDMTMSLTTVSGTNQYIAYPDNWYDTPFQVGVGTNVRSIEFSVDKFPRPTGGTAYWEVTYRMTRFSDGANFGYVRLSAQSNNYTVALNIAGGGSSSFNLGQVLPKRIGVEFNANDSDIYVYVDNIQRLSSTYNTANTPIVLSVEFDTANVAGNDIGVELETTCYTYYDYIKSSSFDFPNSYDPCENGINLPATMSLTDFLTGATASTLGFSSATASITPAPEYQTSTYVTTGSGTNGLAIAIPDHVNGATYKTLGPIYQYAIGMEISVMPTPTPASGDIAVVGLCATQYTVSTISKSYFLGGLRNDAGVDAYIAYRGTTAIYDNTFLADGTQVVPSVTTTKYAMVFNTYSGKVDYYINGQRQFESAQNITAGGSSMFFALAFADNTGTPTFLNPNPVGATYTANMVTGAPFLEEFGLPPEVRDLDGRSIFARAVEWSQTDKSSDITITNDGKTATSTTATWRSVRGSFGKSTGSWYWETTIGASGAVDMIIGIGNSSAPTSSYVGSDANSFGYRSTDGNFYTGGSGTAYGATFTTGDVVGVAFNADTGDVTMYKNGVSQGTMTTLAAGTWYPMIALYNSDATTRFGESLVDYPIQYPVDYYNKGIYGA